MVSYQLVSKNPWNIKRLISPASKCYPFLHDTVIPFSYYCVELGSECGASNIDRAFLSFLDRVVEVTDEGPLRTQDRQRGRGVIRRTERVLLTKFMSIKHAFGGPDESIGNIELPRNCRVLNTAFARSRVHGETRTLQLTQ